MLSRIKKTFFMFFEILLQFVIVPSIRASLMRIAGASIGKNVRIYQTRFFNLESGFKNLTVEDDVHIGIDCLIDLEGEVFIGKGTTISPRVTILTHSNPGSYHQSPLCRIYKPCIENVRIESYCWIGANSTILAGTIIHSSTVVAASSLVRKILEPESLYAGVPAKKYKQLFF